MPKFRRYYVPGGSFFFTLVPHGRQGILATDSGRRLLTRLLRECVARWPMRVEALVLLPDHVHTIWTLPNGDTAYALRIGWLKKEFTKAWIGAGGPERPVTSAPWRDRRPGIWQPKFSEHTIRDESDFLRHMDYLHFNPVKHRLVQCVHEWPWSTFERWVRAGAYPADWGCCCGGRPYPRLPSMSTTVGE